MIKFTFLTSEQVFDKKLDVIKEYGAKCLLTDLSVLLGGYQDIDVSVSSNTYGSGLGYWLTRSQTKDEQVCSVSSIGTRFYSMTTMRGYVARPSFSFSEIEDDKVEEFYQLEDDIFSFEYGKYPQDSLPLKLSINLEKHYQASDGYITYTGNFYTFDSVKYPFGFKGFKPRKFAEFKDKQDNKYIRFVVDYNCLDVELPSYKMPSDTLKKGEIVWVNVKPIKWLLDGNTGIVLSEKALFSGIRFDSEKTYNDDFENTEIYKYMNNYFSNEIIGRKPLINEENLINLSKNKVKKLDDKK